MSSRLCDRQDCTGCGACYNICPHGAIEMQENFEGFLYPIVNNEKCISCGLCTKSCPQIEPIANIRNPIQTTYAAYALDDKIRCASSSGGIFSVIADYVLANNGYVVGAALDKNYRLRHLLISEKAHLEGLRGSKYLQSNTGTVYKQIKERLHSHKLVLFVGTPCQVAGLRQYLARTDTSLLLTCDFICHGVPSHRLFDRMLAYMAKKGEQFSSVRFRDTNNWSIGLFVLKKFLGRSFLQAKDKVGGLYFKAYLSGCMSRECCYRCVYTTTDRTGDLTLADFWNIQERAPLTRKNMQKGVSFIGVNTPKGRELLEKISDKLFLQERLLDEITNNNAQLSRPSDRPSIRDHFYTDLEHRDWLDLIKDFDSAETISWKSRIGKLRIRLVRMKVMVKTWFD